ncbi:MAG: histidine decarboxylase [Candidatus Nomurabacteria bacterium]|nr:histidine decarboxylase [Candidatus Nomurabacteria bacterium]
MKNTLIPLTEEMRQFYWRLKSTSPFMIGYPGNLGNDFTELFKFFDFLINNCGDPNETGSYKMDSKEYENRVLKFFGNIYKFEKFWGYLTSGGTEGNLMGLLTGRIKYPKGIVYSSNSGHYSIRKNITILNVPCKEIKSQYGEIDYEDLRHHLLKEKRPPILNLTIGTTFDGGIDSVDKVIDILKETSHKEFYIHCDAALFGGFLPFLNVEHELDARKQIDSISVSTHKFFGIPFPSGMFFSKEKPGGNFVEYILSHDTTISGSRCGQLAIFLWALIEHKGIAGFKKEAFGCIENAKYLEKLLKEIGYDPYLNNNSNIVSFKTPSTDIVCKYNLATEGTRAHVVVMPHTTKEIIDLLIHSIISLS